MKLTSSATPNAAAFQANRDRHLEALEIVQQAAEMAALGGGERPRARQPARARASAGRRQVIARCARRAHTAGRLARGGRLRQRRASPAAHGL